MQDVTPAAAGGAKHASLLPPAVDLPPGQHRRYMAQLELLMEQATAREKHKRLKAGASPSVATAEAAAWLRAHLSELRAAALAWAVQAEGEGCVGPRCPVPGWAEVWPPLLPTTSGDAAAEADLMALETGLRNSLLDEQARLALSSAPPGVDAAAHAWKQLQAVKPVLLDTAEWRAKAIAEQESSAAWALDPALQPAPPPAPALRPVPAPEVCALFCMSAHDACRSFRRCSTVCVVGRVWLIKPAHDNTIASLLSACRTSSLVSLSPRPFCPWAQPRAAAR